jgi:hypothetical protein
MQMQKCKMQKIAITNHWSLLSRQEGRNNVWDLVFSISPLLKHIHDI